MSHGYSSVDLSSLASMFPEAGFYDMPEGEFTPPPQSSAPADSYSIRPASAGPTLLQAFDNGATDAPRSAPSDSGLFDSGDAMLFDMMGDANAAHYGTDPMAAFGGYDGATPHWKTESSGIGAASTPEALLRRMADDDQARRAADRASVAPAAAKARAQRQVKHAPRPFTPRPAR